jgi:hypothetical protein
MTLVSKKYYTGSGFILSMSIASTGLDRGRGLPSLQLQAPASTLDSAPKLMVGTQQVGEKMTCRLENKEV